MTPKAASDTAQNQAHQTALDGMEDKGVLRRLLRFALIVFGVT